MIRRVCCLGFLFGMVLSCCGCNDEEKLREAIAAKDAAEARAAAAEKRADEAEQRAKAAEQKTADAKLFAKLVGKWTLVKGEPTWAELTFRSDGSAKAKDFNGKLHSGSWNVQGGRLVGALSLPRFISFNSSGHLLLNRHDGILAEELGGEDRYQRESKEN